MKKRKQFKNKGKWTNKKEMNPLKEAEIKNEVLFKLYERYVFAKKM